MEEFINKCKELTSRIKDVTPLGCDVSLDMCFRDYHFKEGAGVHFSVYICLEGELVPVLHEIQISSIEQIEAYIDDYIENLEYFCCGGENIDGTDGMCMVCGSTGNL
jgi:hypothetical protein